MVDAMKLANQKLVEVPLIDTAVEPANNKRKSRQSEIMASIVLLKKNKGEHKRL